MRPHEEDEPEEYRGEPPGERYWDEPTQEYGGAQRGYGRGRGSRGQPRQSRYQSPPPRGGPTGTSQSQSPPTRVDQARQARRPQAGGQPAQGQPAQGQPPTGQSPGGQPPPGQAPQGEPPRGQAPARGTAEQAGIRGQQPPPAGQEPAGQSGTRGRDERPGDRRPTGQPGAGDPGGQSARGHAGDASTLAPIGVEAVLQPDVVTAQRDTPVATVVAKMAEEDVGSVVIVEEGSPVGIVTDREIALALETTPDVAERQVDELVGGDLVSGSTDMTVVEVLRRLSDAGVRRLPIVDEDGALAGIVTIDDVLVLFSEELQNVADVVRTQSPGL